jgi:hypothetical protein
MAHLHAPAHPTQLDYTAATRRSRQVTVYERKQDKPLRVLPVFTRISRETVAYGLLNRGVSSPQFLAIPAGA